MNALFMPGEGRALPNETNRCFINCILQIVLHSKELFSIVKELYSDSEELIGEYYTENRIPVGEQCDSSLFLNFLLDKINKIFNNGINPYYSIAILSKMQCANKHIIRKRQIENIMYVYVQAESNIIELFDSHMRTEIEDYKCETCQKENMSMTTSCKTYGTIESRPRNMFISVQNPNNTKIEIEKDFDFYSEPYVLKGFIKHIGSTQNWGHYVIYILDESGWTIYSDQRITPVSYDTVKKILQKGTSSFERISLLWYIPKVFAPKSYWVCQSVLGNPSPFEAGDLTDSDTESDSDSEIDLENLDKYINDPKFETRSAYPEPDPIIVSSLDEDFSNDAHF